MFAKTESTDSGSTSVKKEKEKKNRKKDKENGSGSGEAGNHDNFDAPEAVVGSCSGHDGNRSRAGRARWLHHPKLKFPNSQQTTW